MFKLQEFYLAPLTLMEVCNWHGRWWIRVWIATVSYQSKMGFSFCFISYNHNLLDYFSVMISVYFLYLHHRIKVFVQYFSKERQEPSSHWSVFICLLEFPQIIVSAPLWFFTTFSKYWNIYISISMGTCLIHMFSLNSCVCTPENKIWDKLSSTWSCFDF